MLNDLKNMEILCQNGKLEFNIAYVSCELWLVWLRLLLPKEGIDVIGAKRKAQCLFCLVGAGGMQALCFMLKNE